MTKISKTDPTLEPQAGCNVERIRSCEVRTPQVDVVENDDRVTLIVDLPGLDESSLEIELENKVLTLRGAHEPAEMEGYTLAWSEFEPGDYERSFRLSSEIDEEQIEAVVKDGVLRVVLPKAKQALSRKISVTAG